MNKPKFIPGKWWIDSNNEILADPMGMLKIGRIYPINEEDRGEANGRLIKKSPEMYEAMKEFCERVEKGEVRSTYTYNKFKQLIKEIDGK